VFISEWLDGAISARGDVRKKEILQITPSTQEKKPENEMK